MTVKSVDRVTFLNTTIFVESFLLLAATCWSQWVELPLMKAFAFSYQAMLLGLGTGIAMALSGLLLYVLAKRLPVFTQLREITESFLSPLLAELKPVDLLIIAILSGFCEEVFFRGVAQQKLGLFITSVAFGLFHDPGFRYVTYMILAITYGLILGKLFEYTGSLWAPIFAHFTHNLISLFVLRYRVKPPETPAAS